MKQHLITLFAITGVFFVTAILSNILGWWLESQGILPRNTALIGSMLLSWVLTWVIVVLYLKKKKLI